MKIYKNGFFILTICTVVLYIFMICSINVNKDMAKVELETEYGDVKQLEDMGVTFDIWDGINNQKVYIKNGKVNKSKVTTGGYEDIHCCYEDGEYILPDKATYDKFLEDDYATDIYGLEEVDGKLLILQREGDNLVAKLLDDKGEEIDSLTIKDTDRLDFEEIYSYTHVTKKLTRICIFDKNNSYMICTRVEDGFKDVYQFNDSNPRTYRGWNMNTRLIDNKLLVYRADFSEDDTIYSNTYVLGIYELKADKQEQIYNGIFTLGNGDVYDDTRDIYSDYTYQQMSILEEDDYDKYR